VLLMMATLAVAGARAAAQAEFPFTRTRGQAAIEFKDPHIHVVAAYYYSQRHHDSRWLLIEAAVSTEELTTIKRDAISLRRPDGREIPLATQTRVGEDVPRIRSLVQNATASRHAVASYFSQRDQIDPMKFFTLPFGGIVHNDFVVDRHRVVVGDLLFEAPTGLWEDGTYALVVRHERGQAQLPIELE
jgi:hypothetical protein